MTEFIILQVFFVPVTALLVVGEGGGGAIHVCNEAVVVSGFLQAGLADLGDRGYGVMPSCFPEVSIEATEEIFNLDVPVPVKVIC